MQHTSTCLATVWFNWTYPVHLCLFLPNSLCYKVFMLKLYNFSLLKWTLQVPTIIFLHFIDPKFISRWIKIMKILIVNFSLLQCYFLSETSKTLSQKKKEVKRIKLKKPSIFSHNSMTGNPVLFASVSYIEINCCMHLFGTCRRVTFNFFLRLSSLCVRYNEKGTKFPSAKLVGVISLIWQHI
jgi:hypothetical protein